MVLVWPGGIPILMYSFRRSALLLVLTVSTSLAVQAPELLAQSSSSQPAPSAPAPQTQQTPQTTGPLTVQARLKARREQRRAAAIREVYSHLYEAYFGTGYLRFTPGAALQRVNEYDWNVGVTRYYSERFGVTVDGRGTYGSAFIGPNAYSNTAIFKPSISQYAALIGPTYRFLLNPRYSVSARILAGGDFGNFSGDLGSFKPTGLGLWPDGASVAISASVPVEYNVTPNVGLRVAPEYFLTSFGSTIQNNLGFTGGIVVRWGKQ
jgi:hypothetical protein